jgi:hypothetical protein
MALNMANMPTKGTGREGEHIQHICAVIVAANALHQWYNNQDQHQTGTTIRQCIVP